MRSRSLNRYAPDNPEVATPPPAGPHAHNPPGASGTSSTPAEVLPESARRDREPPGLAWLALGVCYAVAYVAAGWALRVQVVPLLWFRTAALLVPPVIAVIAIVRRRQEWTGCHWLFWATIALGLVITAVGFVGWTLDEILIARETSWLGWHAVFALFGAVAPLLALLAQPHKGPRESSAATTAVDIAGIAVLAGYLYTYVANGSDAIGAALGQTSISLVFLSELQQFLLLAGLMTAAVLSAGTSWNRTYWRLAIGALVSFLMLSLSNAGIWQGGYRSVFVYDFALILPVFFYPWAAASAPASEDAEPRRDAREAAPGRPWVTFGVLALLPAVDYAMRAAFPVDSSVARLRDISMAVTVVSVLPLLTARLAVERAESRRLDADARRLAATAEQVGDLYRALFENAPLGIFRTTLDGRLLTVNRAFADMLGYDSADELLGLSVDHLFKDQAGGHACVVEWGELGWIDAPEVVWIRRDGRDVRLRLSGRLTAGAGTDERTFEVFAEDVTERRELEAEFRQAQKMEAVGRLAGGVAHDFNNQLTVIMGYSETLLAQIEPGSAVWHELGEIKQAAHHAAALTRRLLAFSRRQVLQLDALDLNDVVRRVEHLLARLLGEDIAIEMHLAGDVGLIKADPVQLEQVLMNLAVNARDAMPGGGRLVIETSAVELSEHYRKPGPVLVRPGRYVMLAVTDTGCGMDPATRSSVFEPFFTTKEQGKGTGLGLSTVYGIVKQLGGYIWVYSEPGIGSTFKLYFPPSGETIRSREAVVAIDPAPVGSETILLVEDEDGVRRFSASLLRRHGYRVLEAANGEEALLVAERPEPIDLVLADVVMPGLNGPEMLARLRANRPVRALFMSGYTERVLRERVLRSQGPLIEKPFGPGELLRGVRQALDARATGPGAPPVGHA